MPDNILLEDGSGGIALEDGSGNILLEDSTPSSFDGVSVVAAIVAWWEGTPAAQALTADGRLWHRSKPESDSLPYATIFLVSDVPEIWTTGYPWRRASVQINLHAATDFAAMNAALALRGLLGKSPAQPAGAPLSVNGVAVAHVLPDGDGIDLGEGLGPDGQDCWIAFEVFDIPWTT